MKKKIINIFFKDCLFKPAKINYSFRRKKTLWTQGTFDKFSKNYQILRNLSKEDKNILKSSEMNFPIPEGTLVDAIWSKINKWPDKTALVCGVTGRSIKYNELQEKSKKVATSLLINLNINPGQVLCIILPNSLEYPSLILGALEARILVSPINILNKPDEIYKYLKSVNAVAVATSPTKLPDILEAVGKLHRTDFKIIVTPNIDGSEMLKLPGNAIYYSSLTSNKINIEQLASKKPKLISQNETAIIPFSSGTTGIPKPVCLSHRNLLANNVNVYYQKLILDTTNEHQDVVPMVLPVSHIFALTVILMSGLYSGVKIIVLPKFERKMYLNAVQHYQSTVLVVVPTLIKFLGLHPSVNKRHFTSVRAMFSGASSLSETELKKCLKKLPENVICLQGYGLTETSPVISIGSGRGNFYSVGPPVPNTEIKILDTSHGRALGVNEEGEILVRGPQIMKEYLNNPKATAEVIDKEGWLHTGDIGYYDKDKNLYITDRAKDLIKVKGFPVSPTELEAVLLIHPAVLEVGVIGVPHPKTGETPVAFIRCLIKNTKKVEGHLKALVKEKLASYKQISEYIFVDEIPKSAIGKVLRRELKKMYTSRK